MEGTIVHQSDLDITPETTTICIASAGFSSRNPSITSNRCIIDTASDTVPNASTHLSTI